MSHLQGGTNHTHYIAGHKDPLGEIRYTVDKPSVIGETFQALSLAAGGGQRVSCGRDCGHTVLAVTQRGCAMIDIQQSGSEVSANRWPVVLLVDCDSVACDLLLMLMVMVIM